MYTTVITAVKLLIQILCWAIIIKCILSWIPKIQGTVLCEAVDSFVEPILAPIRNFLMKSNVFGNLPIDFSPIIAIIILDLISSLI